MAKKTIVGQVAGSVSDAVAYRNRRDGASDEHRGLAKAVASSAARRPRQAAGHREEEGGEEGCRKAVSKTQEAPKSARPRSAVRKTKRVVKKAAKKATKRLKRR